MIFKAMLFLTAVWLGCGDAAVVISRPKEDKTPFTLEEALFGPFGQRSYSGHWVSTYDLQYVDEETGDVMMHKVDTDERWVYLNRTILDKYQGNGFSIAPDDGHVLISYDSQSGFRHSSSHRYVIYVFQTGEYIELQDGAFLQTAAWGPSSTLLNLVYVHDNDLYYVSGTDLKTAHRVTTSGVPGLIYNAVPDWVYEEEVLGAATAYWFSPEGDKLIYFSFNDTEVPEITYLHYGEPGNIETNYPQEMKIRYPKAGENNPMIEMYQVDLSDLSKAKEVPFPRARDDVIGYGVQWANNEEYAVVFTNRVQNISQTWICNATTLECTMELDQSNDKGWAYTDLPTFDTNGTRYLKIAPQSVGNLGDFNHLTLYDRILKESKGLTNGEFVVTSIAGWDEHDGIVYITATEEKKPSTQQVYAVMVDGSGSECLTCGILTPEGRPCTSASASFSFGFEYALVTCSGPDPRFTQVYVNALVLGTPILTLEDNAALRERLESKLLPKPFDLRAVVEGQDVQAEVRLWLPPNVDINSSAQKYPLLINVYAGPDSKQISDNFGLGWQAYLTTNLSVIYGFIDARGSANKGNNMLYAGYRALGSVEIMDQISITKILQLLPFVDPARVAIWGWSYGGYATGKTLEMDTEGVFKCGISVAPVTSWIYYDSIYTERYMGLPTEGDNLANYTQGDLLHDVSNLHNKQYYLIHGNGDDNVHYQQSMLLSRALELNDVLFQQQSYPDENHSLGGVSQHLYHSMNMFWKDCFEI